MGSVQDSMECKYCGYKYGTSDYYYKSGEEYFWCDRCGSSYSNTIDNRLNNNEYPDDWKPHFKFEEHILKNAYSIGGEENGIRQCGGVKKELLKLFIQNARNSPNIGYAYYTYKYRGVWYKKNILTGEKTVFVGSMEEQYEVEE